MTDEVWRLFDERADLARTSAVRHADGRQLYTSADRTPTFRERLERLRRTLAH